MPWALSFIGPHNVGKTTLLLDLTRELTSRGLKVGFLKSSKEDEADLERQGADTRQVRQAGAKISVFWGQKELFLSKEAPLKDDFSFWSLVSKELASCDLVLAEGFKSLLSVPKIEILPPHPQEFLYQRVPGVIALVGELKGAPIPIFKREEITRLADFILERKPRVKEQTLLIVDGKPIGLTRFVSRALSGMLAGFLSHLRGVKDPQRVEILLNLGQNDFES